MTKKPYVLSLNTGSETVEIGRFPDAFSLHGYLNNIPWEISHSMTLSAPCPQKPDMSAQLAIGNEYWLHDSLLGTRNGRTAKKNRVVLDCIRPEIGREYVVFRGVNKNGTPSDSPRQITHMPIAMLGKLFDSGSILLLDSKQENYQPISKTTGLDFYYNDNRQEISLGDFNG